MRAEDDYLFHRVESLTTGLKKNKFFKQGIKSFVKKLVLIFLKFFFFITVISDRKEYLVFDKETLLLYEYSQTNK